jgi:hypothetical protein
MTRPRLIAGLTIPVALAIAIVLVLFTNRDQQSPPTITAAAPTTVPATTQPTQDQWLTIVRQIVDYRHSLFENPQPGLLENIYDKRCPCYAQDYRILVDLQRRGLHYSDKGTEVRSAKLVGRARDPKKPIVAVEAVTRQLPQVLVDRSGKAVKETPGSQPSKTIYNLIRGSDNVWRAYLVYKGLG